MKQLDIAILGMGTVGSGTYRVIEQEADYIAHKKDIKINVKKVLALDYSIDIPEEKKAKDIDEIVNDPDIKVVVELMGGKEPAKTFMLKALEAGKSVVSANKELVSQAWPELEATAKKTGAGLYFEAAVGGGIPILRTIQESLQANTITSVYGIINGTTNYILSKMAEENLGFDEVLKTAQDLGYAEANPTADVDAFDAMYKLSILATLAFHVRLPIEHIYREGIRAVTQEDIAASSELGFVIKLLAIAKREGESVELRVHPTMIPKTHPLANVSDSFNAVFMTGSAVDDVMFYGRGAGDFPTASAVVSDVINAGTDNARYTSFLNSPDELSPTLIFNDDWQTGFFLRLLVQDTPGVLAGITNTLAKHDISIKSVIQKDVEQDGNASIIMIMHKCSELSMRAALEEIKNSKGVAGIASCIRVES